MTTILNEQEEKELREHLALKVRPRFQSRTIDRIVTKINQIRTGEASEDEYVNPVTKVLKWSDMLENWNLLGRFVELK